MPIGGDQRSGGAAEDRPPFDVALGGMYGARPYRLLIIDHEPRHAHERMKPARSLKQILLFENRSRGLGFNGSLVLLLRYGGAECDENRRHQFLQDESVICNSGSTV